jgi:hypothetical protein
MGLSLGTTVSCLLAATAVCFFCVDVLTEEAGVMNAFCRLVVAVSVLSVFILGSARTARAQLEAFAVMAAVFGETVEQGLYMPSLGGPTGIVSMPNGCTRAAGEWQAALSYQGMRASSSGMYQTADDLSVWSLQAAHGMKDATEVWAAYSSAADGEGSRVWGLGAKKMLRRSEGEGPVVAVGASYHRWRDAFPAGSWTGGDARPDANVTKAYAVVTEELAGDESFWWLLGSGGLVYIDVDPDSGRSQSLTRPFVGLQAVFLAATVLGLEYRWEDSSIDAEPVSSLALRFVLSLEPPIAAEVGTTNASPVGTGLPTHRGFVRLSYGL